MRDPNFMQARTAAFDILYGTARQNLISIHDADVASLAIAGWSMSHGYATLVATDNLADRPPEDIFRGVELLARLIASHPEGDEATQ